jgi:hypothetical protein
MDPTCTASFEVLLTHTPMLQSFSAIPDTTLDTQSAVTAQALVQVARYRQQLIHVTLTMPVTGGTEGCKVKFFSNCARLSYFACTGTGMEFTDTVMQTLAEQCIQLVSIDITAETSITDAGLTALALKRPRMRHISIGVSDSVTDESLHALAKHSRELSCWVLRGPAQVTGTAQLHVAQACTNLTTLHIVGSELSAEVEAQIGLILQSRRPF